MRIRMNDERERRYENLEKATGENTRSGALDVASKYYVRMAGGSPAMPDGAIHELMTTAVEQGSVTPEQIAEVLDQPELAVRYEHEWSVGYE